MLRIILVFVLISFTIAPLSVSLDCSVINSQQGACESEKYTRLGQKLLSEDSVSGSERRTRGHSGRKRHHHHTHHEEKAFHQSTAEAPTTYEQHYHHHHHHHHYCGTHHRHQNKNLQHAPAKEDAPQFSTRHPVEAPISYDNHRHHHHHHHHHNRHKVLEYKALGPAQAPQFPSQYLAEAPIADQNHHHLHHHHHHRYNWHHQSYHSPVPKPEKTFQFLSDFLSHLWPS